MTERYHARKAISLQAITLLILLPAIGCFHNPSSVTPVGDHYDLFATVWEQYEEYYPEFPMKNIDWKELFHTYSEIAETASSSEEVMMNAVVPMLGELCDLHAWIITPDDSLLYTYTSDAVPNYDYDVLASYIIPAGFTGYSGNIGYCDPNKLPYISIGSWSGTTDVSRFRDFMELCQEQPAIIIDIRMNTGGWSAPGAEIAGFFTTSSKLAYYMVTRSGPEYCNVLRSPRRTDPDPLISYTGRVYLLAGSWSASASEVFVLHMNCLDNVTVLGDTTKGAGVMHIETDIGEGWKVRIPQWSLHNPDMQPVEWYGIPPDVPVEATPEDFAAGVDPVLEYAIEQLENTN